MISFKVTMRVFSMLYIDVCSIEAFEKKLGIVTTVLPTLGDCI